MRKFNKMTVLLGAFMLAGTCLFAIKSTRPLTETTTNCKEEIVQCAPPECCKPKKDLSCENLKSAEAPFFDAGSILYNSKM